MKIGLLLCSYGYPEYVDRCLEPWLKLKKTHDIQIATINGMFKEYVEMDQIDNDKETQEKLTKYHNNKQIDFLYIHNATGENRPVKEYHNEAQLRDIALQYLLKQNCDLIWLWDIDEIATVEELERTIQYIQQPENKFIVWFRTEYKNCFDTEDKYIKGFNPPRIWRAKSNNYELDSCYYDNDFTYKGVITRDIIKDNQFPNKSIPTSIFNAIHLSWLSTEKSKNKIKYQISRGWDCSNIFNEKTNKIEFNREWYKKRSLQIPNIFFI